ncbi:hypothetical protein [Sorangium sp. So ce1099]|uniref:hypothetical protein n=1 Tax=Sorangium sp. So ce1099 TaxID=3133331 RepID=UPI003F61DCCB
MRTPTGAQHQLSFFGTPSQLDDPPARLGHDGISDTGEVMFLNPPKRYLGAPGAAPREIGSHLGHPRWFQGAWYVVMGNTGCAVAARQPGLGGALEAVVLAALGLAMAARASRGRPGLGRDRSGTGIATAS